MKHIKTSSNKTQQRVYLKESLLTQRIFHGLPLLIVLGGYVGFIFSRYWMFPVTSDGLGFCYHSVFPSQSTYVFFRFFNFYLAKIITFPFENLLKGYAFVSLLYHVGIIIFAYLITRKLAGKVQGLLAAILTALCPLFFLFATEYFSDTACLFFGLGALYFSLIGNDHPKIHLKYFLSGFLLIASFFSKPFGIVFIIPVFINIWPHRTIKRFCSLFFGILGALLFIAICDQIWGLGFFYHLNPNNYLEYKDMTAPTGGGDPNEGRSLEITDGWSLAYLIFFMAFLFQALRFFERRKNFDWKKRGSLSFALTGLILVVVFAIESYISPVFWVHSHYYYCLLIPWIIAFCSVLRFLEESRSEKRLVNKSNIIAVILSILFVIALFTTQDHNQYDLLKLSFGRFFYLVSLWILLFATALVLVAGNYLQRYGYRTIAAFVFLLGCFGIFWHNANWANKFSTDSTYIKVYKQTKSFFKKYQELSQKSPVVPFDCYYDVGRGFEIQTSLLFANLADQENLKFFRETRNLKETVRTISTPFYMLTKYKIDFLTHTVNSLGLQVIPVPDGTYFSCTFYLIVDSD